MRSLYSLIWYAILPLVLLRLIVLSFRQPAYLQRCWQRLGYIPIASATEKSIWLHAVSVGEVVAARTIIRNLKQRCPDYKIVVTTGTPTGAETVKQLFQDSVTHYYQPYDLPIVIRRFIRRLQPHILLVMETELWPNLFHYCQQSAIDVVLLNSRMSARSAKRYSRFKTLTRQMLDNVRAISCQTDEDAERLRRLGANPDRITITGSVKFDIQVDDAVKQEAEQIKSTQLSGRKIWIAASTHAGEEQQVLAVHRQLLKQFPDCLLILAPRHYVRSADIVKLIESHRLAYVCRQAGQAVTRDRSVLLLDTMGELLLFYAVADLAFVGGSLVPHGGHNPIEPGYFAKPVLFGPHDANFAAINRAFIQQQAAIRVNDQAELQAQLSALFNEPQRARALGDNASRYIQAQQGASDKVWKMMAGLLS